MHEAPDPHREMPVVSAGPPASEAAGGLVLVHGRGATARSILSLADELGRDDLACRAPQAADNTWYPYSFLAPLAQNEPGLSSALGKLERVVEELESSGVPSQRIVLLGFSQGACLVTEFAARNGRRWGGVAALTGGVLGPPGTPRQARPYPGDLAGTPVFLGTSDPDPHVPRERVEETAEIFRDLGAEVTLEIYPGMGHTVNRDEIDHVRRLLNRLG